MKILLLLALLLTLNACQSPSRLQAASLMDSIKTVGLTLPPMLLARADEVIE